MTTPAAWTEMCRTQPSSFFAKSIICFVSFSVLYAWVSSGTISIAWSMVIGMPWEPIGIILESLSPMAYRKFLFAPLYLRHIYFLHTRSFHLAYCQQNPYRYLALMGEKGSKIFQTEFYNLSGSHS